MISAEGVGPRSSVLASLRMMFPSCVVWPTSDGFDVLIPRYWDNGQVLVPSPNCVATARVTVRPR